MFEVVDSRADNVVVVVVVADDDSQHALFA